MHTLLTPARAEAPLRLEFTGNGAEYFGIWIVNILLTILTLGIYSAWAKVRRLRYFYQHTELAGSGFEYHGNPIAILKGRILALLLFVGYNASVKLSGTAFLIALLVMMVVLPWMLRQSFRFRLHNSSYRGLRFSFHGDLPTAYTTFLGWGLLTIFTAYLAAPAFHQRLKQYQHGNSRFGTTPFRFDASIGQFFGAYALVLLLTLGLLGASVGGTIFIARLVGEMGGNPSPELVTGVIAMAFLVMIIGALFIVPLWRARTQNLIWNHTRLGEHQFSSEVRAWPLMGIMLGNFLLVLLTLGLFMPWAQVRMARYLSACLSVQPEGSPDDFLAASQATEVGATGDAAAEFFDFDIGL